MNQFPIEFISWYTGDSAKTILSCYDNWLVIKIDNDEDFLPVKNKPSILKQCKDKTREKDGPCKYPIGTCEWCKNNY